MVRSRISCQFRAAACCTLLALCWSTSTYGGDADAASPKSDDLSQVLQNWTATGSEIRTLSCRFTRYDYDSSRQTETRGYGKIHFEADGRALYAVDPYPLKSDTRSTRASAAGKPYELQAMKAEWLYWISGQVARISPTRHEFELFEVPEPFHTTGVVEATESFDILWTRLGCLQRQVPGLIETDTEELHRRFEWSLVTFDETQIVLRGTPLTAADKRHSSALYVYLHPKTYLPRGTKQIDSTGTQEVVHAFADVKVNAVTASSEPDWAPNIGRMRLLTAPPLAPPASE